VIQAENRRRVFGGKRNTVESSRFHAALLARKAGRAGAADLRRHETLPRPPAPIRRSSRTDRVQKRRHTASQEIEIVLDGGAYAR